MIAKVISGGQTGVDQAALRAAKACGIPTGGFAPKGWWTEKGAAPWLAEFGLQQLGKAGYAARTAANVRMARATVVLTVDEPTGGTLLTLDLAQRFGKLVSLVKLTAGPDSAGWPVTVKNLRKFLACVRTVNVGGPRESKSPGIGELAEKFLCEVFAA